MKTCKDCIHDNVCPKESYATDMNPYIDFSTKDDVDESCIDFKNKFKYIELPCIIGTDLYRIDSRYKTCSFKGQHKDEWYCFNVLNCNEECDSNKEYYIYEIKNADAMTILGNSKYLGTRVFTSREEAEKKLVLLYTC